MKFSILAILPLLAMQSIEAMKKPSIKEKNTHKFQIIIAKPDAEWLEKLAKTQQTEEWKILEKNRTLTQELFQSDILAKQSSQITSTLIYIKNVLNKAESSTKQRALLAEKSNLKSAFDQELKKQYENVKTALDLAEKGDAQVHNLVLTKLLDCLKQNNELGKQTIFEMEQEIVGYLNNEETLDCIYNPQLIEMELKTIKSRGSTAKECWYDIEEACKEFNAILSLRKINEEAIENLTTCHNHLEKCFDTKSIRFFQQALASRVKGHEELKNIFIHKYTVLKELIAAKESAIIDYYNEWIRLIRTAPIKIQNWTSDELKKALENKQTIEKHLNVLVPCTLISDTIKIHAKLLHAFNNKLIESINKKLTLAPAKVTLPERTQDPDKEPIPKGYFPLCKIEADVHTKSTIINALEKWKHCSSLALDPTNTILYPEERARAHSFHFVSNGNTRISLAMIKQKKNSKKPFKITDDIQFIDEDKQAQWIQFENVGPDKVYHSQHQDKFYLYCPTIDAQNAYLVENILAECTIDAPATATVSSDGIPNPTTDEK